MSVLSLNSKRCFPTICYRFNLMYCTCSAFNLIKYHHVFVPLSALGGVLHARLPVGVVFVIHPVIKLLISSIACLKNISCSITNKDMDPLFYV